MENQSQGRKKGEETGPQLINLLQKLSAVEGTCIIVAISETLKPRKVNYVTNPRSEQMSLLDEKQKLRIAWFSKSDTVCHVYTDCTLKNSSWLPLYTTCERKWLISLTLPSISFLPYCFVLLWGTRRSCAKVSNLVPVNEKISLDAKRWCNFDKMHVEIWWLVLIRPSLFTFDVYQLIGMARCESHSFPLAWNQFVGEKLGEQMIPIIRKPTVLIIIPWRLEPPTLSLHQSLLPPLPCLTVPAS